MEEEIIKDVLNKVRKSEIKKKYNITSKQLTNIIADNELMNNIKIDKAIDAKVEELRKDVSKKVTKKMSTVILRNNAESIAEWFQLCIDINLRNARELINEPDLKTRIIGIKEMGGRIFDMLEVEKFKNINNKIKEILDDSNDKKDEKIAEVIININ